MNELISVIITTHKRSVHLIDRALNSVLNQTYKNIEIIIVSDNFNDKPLQKSIEEYFNNNYSNSVNLKLATEALGANRARNIGAASSHGKYLAFLDDDDVWFSNKLEVQQSAFINNEIAIVYCDEYGFNENNNLIFSKKYVDISKKPLDFLFKKGNVIGGASNPLIRKDSFYDVGCFDEKLLSSQDLDLWVRLVQQFKIAFVNKKLLICFYHQPGFTGITNNYLKKKEGFEQYCNKHWNIISTNKSYLKRVYKYRCQIAIISKDKQLFKKQFRELVKHFPFSVFINLKIYLSWLRNR